MIKEFFTDPFGLKRIAVLQSEVRLLQKAYHVNCEYIEDLRDEVSAQRKVIRELRKCDTQK
jgi:hypothetical protein